MKITKKQIFKVLKAIVTDLLFMVGLSSVAYGIWQIYSPLAFIFLGSFIIYMVLPAKKAKSTEKGR